MKLLEYADEEMLTIDLANTLAGELRAALVHEDRVLFVVPGARRRGRSLTRCAIPTSIGRGSM